MNRFDFTISPAILTAERLRPQVEKANQWLETMLGQSTSTVRAVWDMRSDPAGRESVTLKLSDFTCPEGLVEAFRPEHLSDRAYTERRLYRLFGDLLQNRTRVLLDDLVGSSGPQGQ